MRTKTKVLIAILFLPGLLGEILSTNMPVENLLRPFGLFGLVVVYGLGSLIIREAKIRWKMQWSIIFLAIAYGIYEEALVTRAFFNPYWFGPGPLSAQWMIFGVQWGWTIVLFVFHASMSTLIPIYLISEVWPEMKDKPLLGRKGTAIVFLGITAALILGATVFPMGGRQNLQNTPFYPDPMLLVWSFVSIGLLILLAYRLRRSRLKFKVGLLPPAAIIILSFVFQLGNILVPNILVNAGVMAELGIGIQLLFVAVFAIFAASQLLHEKAGKGHFVGYAFGSILSWVVISLMSGAGGRTDLLAVAPVALVLLVLWRRRVLKR